MTCESAGSACRLFVYGTLAPGQANHGLLAKLSGTWQEGFITGFLYPKGFGPTAGYPVVDLENPVESVGGFLLTSTELPGHWSMLDDFEGEGYRRVKTMVALLDASRLEAFVYALDLGLLPSVVPD